VLEKNAYKLKIKEIVKNPKKKYIEELEKEIEDLELKMDFFEEDFYVSPESFFNLEYLKKFCSIKGYNFYQKEKDYDDIFDEVLDYIVSLNPKEDAIFKEMEEELNSKENAYNFLLEYFCGN
jgi:hypothetical protein